MPGSGRKTAVRTAVLAVLAAAAVLSAAPSQARVGSCSDPVTFGTTISRSGAGAAAAERWAKLTIEFAKLINEKGGLTLAGCDRKLPLQLVIYDDESNPETAAALYARLAAKDGVDFFVGPDGTEIGAEVADVADDLKIPTVMANVPSPDVFRRGGKYVWGVPMPTVAAWSARYFDMLSKRSPAPRTILFITEDTPRTKEIGTRWIAGAQAAGLKVLHEEISPSDIEDFTALALKLRLRRPDVIYIASAADWAAPLIRRMRELNVRAATVHHAMIGAALAGPDRSAIEGVTGDIGWYPGIDGPYAGFVETLLERAEIDMFAHPATMSRLAAYLIMVQAVERAGVVDREDLEG